MKTKINKSRLRSLSVTKQTSPTKVKNFLRQDLITRARKQHDSETDPAKKKILKQIITKSKTAQTKTDWTPIIVGAELVGFQVGGAVAIGLMSINPALLPLAGASFLAGTGSGIDGLEKILANSRKRKLVRAQKKIANKLQREKDAKNKNK